MDNSNHKNSNTPYIILIVAVLILAVGAGSFYGGITYQKNHSPVLTTAAAAGGTRMFGTGPSGRAMSDSTFGTVTAISAASITVKDTRINITKTMTISSGTKVSDGGASSSLSAVKVGDEVIITASESDSATASEIILNPPTMSTGGSMQSIDSIPL
jgi:hypothetical protein